MRASSLGYHSRSARPRPPVEETGTAVAASTTWTKRSRTWLPWVLVPVVSLTEIFVIAFALKTAHPHPHRHEDRFQWQTNILFNIVLAYFALETASPLVFYVGSKCPSAFVHVGLYCDFFTAWGIAVACTIPVEFYVAAGDVDVHRPYMIVLYAGFVALLVLRTLALLAFVRRLTNA